MGFWGFLWGVLLLLLGLFVLLLGVLFFVVDVVVVFNARHVCIMHI